MIAKFTFFLCLFKLLLQNYWKWVLLLIPWHFLFDRLVLAPVLSRSAAWFSKSSELDFAYLIIASIFTNSDVCVIFIFDFRSDLGSEILTVYKYTCTSSLLQWCEATSLVLGCGLSVEMICPHFAPTKILISSFHYSLSSSALEPSKLYVDMITLRDQICLDQSSCIGI